MNMIQQDSDYTLRQFFIEKRIFDLQVLNENYAFQSSFSSFSSFLPQPPQSLVYQDNHFSSGFPISLFGPPLFQSPSGVLEKSSSVVASSPFDFHHDNNNMTQDFPTQQMNQILLSSSQFQTTYESPNETKINVNNHNQEFKPAVAVGAGHVTRKADVAGFEPELKTGGNGNNTKRRKVEVKMEGDKQEVVIKGQWTSAEDRLLIRLVEKHGKGNWAKIANMLRGRVGKQCRERWQNHLQPHIKKDKWSDEEDRMLIAAHKELGNKWSEMAKVLPGRSENTIKNHWNATKRKQLAAMRRGDNNDDSNKCITVLQNYINSLMFSTPPPAAAAATDSINYPPPHNTAAAAGVGVGETLAQPNENNSVYEYCYLEKEELFQVPVCGGGEEDSFYAMMCSNGSGYEFGSSPSASINGIMRSGTVTPSTATTGELMVDAKTEMDFLTGDYNYM